MALDEQKRDGVAESEGQAYHVPVMLKEAVDGLAIDPSGTYVDCTFGGGGQRSFAQQPKSPASA